MYGFIFCKLTLSTFGNCGWVFLNQGFNPDSVQPQLRYGDSIYLIPEGTSIHTHT
jgi:hypothetical protein